MEPRSRTPARLLAPVAVVVFAVALLLVVTSAGGGDHSKSQSQATKQEQRDLELKRSHAAKKKQKAGNGKLPQGIYVVKTGDTLGSIAEKTGIPVEKLQELNPDLDPQALVSGQRIKLR
jgi:LysM repeat protein